MAASSTKMLDPDGDIIIVLTESANDISTPADTVATPSSSRTQKGKKFHFRVSSEKLRPVSTILREMVEQAQKGHKGDSPCKVEASGFDPNAFSIVFGILHDQYDDVPDKPNFATIRNIGIIVDHYKCLEEVGRFSRQWLLLPDRPTPTEGPSINIDLQQAIDWLFVSLVFHDKPTFLESTKVLIERSTGLLKTRLPIPMGLLEDIGKRRTAVLQVASETADLHGVDEESQVSLQDAINVVAGLAGSYEHCAEEAELANDGFGNDDEEFEELSGDFGRLDDTASDMSDLMQGFRLLDDGSWDTTAIHDGLDLDYGIGLIVSDDDFSSH